MALEDDPHKNQKEFWNVVKRQNTGGAEVKWFAKKGQVIGEDE